MPRPTSREKHPLSVALVALRKHLGETQQQFANRLGVAVTTVARYETSNPPRGPVLEKLMKIALDAEMEDVSRMFERAALAHTETYVRMQTLDELTMCTAVLAIMRREKYEKVWKRLYKLLRPVLDEFIQRDEPGSLERLRVEIATTAEGAKIFDLSHERRLLRERNNNKAPDEER